MKTEKEIYWQTQENGNWNNPKSAGYLSRYILWNKPTLRESMNNANEINKTYNFKLS